MKELIEYLAEIREGAEEERELVDSSEELEPFKKKIDDSFLTGFIITTWMLEAHIRKEYLGEA